jgi:hypothetical protein
VPPRYPFGQVVIDHGGRPIGQQLGVGQNGRDDVPVHLAASEQGGDLGQSNIERIGLGHHLGGRSRRQVQRRTHLGTGALQTGDDHVAAVGILRLGFGGSAAQQFGDLGHPRRNQHRLLASACGDRLH